MHHSLIWRRRRRNVGQIRARSQKAVDVRGEGKKVGNVEASQSLSRTEQDAPQYPQCLE